MTRGLPHALRHLVSRRATSEARSLVLSLIAQNPKPPTVQDLYKLAVQHQEQNLQQEGTSSDAESRVVIPSMRYLKKVVLPDLQLAGAVEKIHAKEAVSEETLEKLRSHMSKTGRKVAATPSSHVELWTWQLKAPEPEAPPPQERKRFGTEVGVGADWSHLNKRRQRARVVKVAQDVKWLKELDKAKREGLGESS